MPQTSLKKLRLLAGKTQTEVAAAVGTSQPNYQRWETEKSKIPESKLKKLAKLLGATEHEILGEPKPFDLFGIDDEVEDSRTYYGEVAFHFSGGGAPLLLPVSEEERVRIHRQFDSNSTFISTRSLDNRLLLIRRQAIDDLYISSEAYDSFGPESYPGYVGVAPDDDFWRAIEYIEKTDKEYCIFDYPDDLDESYVNDVFHKVVLTDKKLKALIANGSVKEDEKEQVQEEATKKTEALISRARYASWQLSTGKLRKECIPEPDAIVSAFCTLEIDPDDEDEVLQIPFEGYHRTVVINKCAVDYISVPSHMYDSALLAEVEQELDS